MRKTPIVTGELYHIFNRGVDKRIIFSDEYDVERFMQSIRVFNTIDPIGSIFEQQFNKEFVISKPLVTIVAYCLLSNHFHLILKQEVDNGISQYMKRLTGGYTWYFNNKHKRSGALMQGSYKAVHIDSNEYLLYVSAYVNLNDKQSLGDRTAKLIRPRSSFNEYAENSYSDKQLCLGKDIILGQFNNRTEYREFAYKVLEEVLLNKKRYSILGED
ncbi:MAG: transposase [Patescibacteria group bacterium]